MSEMQDIHGLADGELSGEAKAAAEKRLSESREAQAEYTAVMQLKSALTEKLATSQSSETWTKCARRLREFDRARTAEFLVGKYAFAGAAVLAVAILSAAYLNRIGAGASMDASSLARTISASTADHPGLNGGSLERAVEWIKRQLGGGVPPPQVDATELQLRRVDISEKGPQPIARYLFTDGSAVYVLLVAPGVTNLDGKALPGYRGVFHSRLGRLNVLCWRDGNCGFALAAERPVETLLSLIR